jgi:hypothetical protein
MELRMTLTHLNQDDLSARWKISPRTLERWRWTGEGPKFLKIGGRVIYRLVDVEAYEEGRQCASTAEKPSKDAPPNSIKLKASKREASK